MIPGKFDQEKVQTQLKYTGVLETTRIRRQVSEIHHNLAWVFSLRKQPTFHDVTTGFPEKWLLRNSCRNSILMTRHYPDLGSASFWLKQNSSRCTTDHSTTQIWIVTSHRYGISALVAQTSFRGETSGGVAKCRLVSHNTHAAWSVYWPRLDHGW